MKNLPNPHALDKDLELCEIRKARIELMIDLLESSFMESDITEDLLCTKKEKIFSAMELRNRELI